MYAWCRIADDIADEPWTSDPNERLAAFDMLEGALRGFQPAPRHPLFIALEPAMEKHKLLREELLNLLIAFRADVNFRRPRTWMDVMEYCRYSANPVGRAVLTVAGVNDSRAFAASDAACTALQLVNFCQDVSVDFTRNRIYFPNEYLIESDSGLGKALDDVFARIDELWIRSHELGTILKGRVGLEIKSIIAAGRAIHRKNKSLHVKLRITRPRLRIPDYIWLLPSVIIWSSQKS